MSWTSFGSRAQQVADHRRNLRAVDPFVRLRRHRVGDIGMVFEPLLELGPPDDLHLGRSGCRERGRPPAAGDHRDLADDVPLPDPADDHVAVRAVRGRHEFAGRDDVHVIGLVALTHEHLTVEETDAAEGYVEVPHLWRPEFHPVNPPSSTCRGADGESSPWGPNDPPRETSMPCGAACDRLTRTRSLDRRSAGFLEPKGELLEATLVVGKIEVTDRGSGSIDALLWL